MFYFLSPISSYAKHEITDRFHLTLIQPLVCFTSREQNQNTLTMTSKNSNLLWDVNHVIVCELYTNDPKSCCNKKKYAKKYAKKHMLISIFLYSILFSSFSLYGHRVIWYLFNTKIKTSGSFQHIVLKVRIVNNG